MNTDVEFGTTPAREQCLRDQAGELSEQINMLETQLAKVLGVTYLIVGSLPQATQESAQEAACAGDANTQGSDIGLRKRWISDYGERGS